MMEELAQAVMLVNGGSTGKSWDNCRNAPLHLTAVKGNVAVAEALIANGANVHARTKASTRRMVANRYAANNLLG